MFMPLLAPTCLGCGFVQGLVEGRGICPMGATTGHIFRTVYSMAGLLTIQMLSPISILAAKSIDDSDN